jgi:hydrophobic/amphiphilic exporter-1 (mainly G- bacteria), HAE1 family
MFLSDTAIKRPVSTLLFTSGILIFGYVAFTGMGVDLFPEVELPTVTVTSILPGADPEIMDLDVTDVLEEQINTIEGVKRIISRSTEGISQVVVEFVLSKDVDIAAQEVRDKVSLARADLPLDLEPPLVQKLDIAAQPILWIAVTTSGDYRRIARYADEVIKERLQTIPGVGAVVMGGFQEREIRLWLVPEQLEARGLSPLDVVNAVQARHIELPGGRIEQPDREFVVKVKGEYETVEELRSLVVSQQDGAVVYLRDVAVIEDGSEDLRSVARFNGLPSVGLGIRKQSGTNTVAVARMVKEEVERIRAQAPEGINLQIASDSSRFIENSMEDVIFDLFLGAILTSLVMLVFLRNFRMTMISVAAIPVSIIGSFVVMYWLDFTINNMTMLAMSLAIGIVIDDAIVVLENIFRHVEEGQGAMAAARLGTSEVGLAVLAASSSIVAVFLPVAFMQGIIGRFFFQFGLSVALSVLVSVVVSFTLTPMLCSRLLKHDPNHGTVFQAFERAFRHAESWYSRWLAVALQRRWATLGLALGLFVAGLALIPFLKKGFLTEPDESRFLIRFELPTGTSVEATDNRLRTIERLVLSQPEVRSAFAATGFTGEPNAGILFVNLVYPGERSEGQQEIMVRLRQDLAQAVPEARVAIEYISAVGGGQRNAEIQFIVQGPSVELLDQVAGTITEQVRNLPGFVDVDNDLRLNKPELKVSINRDLADDLGVDVRTIARNFGILYGGWDVAKFKEGGKRFDIRARAAPEARERPEDLLQPVVHSMEGRPIQAPNLVQVVQGFGPNAINRYNRSRAATIYANLEGIPLGEALPLVNQIAAVAIPAEPGWGTGLSGTSDAFTESFQYLLAALGIAMLMIYLILGAQFESFIHPLTIMMSVPLAIAGSFGLLLITRTQLDIFSFIGLVMLVGIVTKNAILLLDFTIQIRARGVSREEALLKAGPLRLRPILMTALTTIAAVTPVALALSEGGELRAPMGMAVIGGMLTSTFLTLFVVPCFYSVVDDIGAWTMRGIRQTGLMTAAGEETVRTDSGATR